MSSLSSIVLHMQHFFLRISQQKIIDLAIYLLNAAKLVNMTFMNWISNIFEKKKKNPLKEMQVYTWVNFDFFRDKKRGWDTYMDIHDISQDTL